MPTPLATENWSERRMAFGRTAQRGFLVTGVSSEAEAVSTVNSTFANAAALNAEMPGDARLLLLSEPDVEMKGPAAYHVGCQYVYGENRPAGASDKLDLAPQFRIQIGNKTDEAADDAEGNAILNSAGQRPDVGVFRFERTLFLRVMKWQTDVDLALMYAYTNTCNSDTVHVPRLGEVGPGQMFCEAITPIDAFDQTTARLRVEYRFELRKGKEQDANGRWTGFKTRFTDRGFVGWYNNSGLKSGRLWSATGEGIAEPAMLDGHGLPIDTTLTVEGKTAVQYQTLRADLFQQVNGGVVLTYPLYDYLPFVALGLF